MANKRNILGWGFLIISIILALTLRLAGSRMYESGSVFAVVNNITSLYQLKRIAAGISTFLYGYALLCFFMPKMNFYWRLGLSAPVALALWSCISVLVLMFRIPYNPAVMLGIMLVLLSAVCFIRHGKIRYLYQEGKMYIFGIVFGIIVLISTGLLPIIMTGDSYNYVMKYGMVIANEESLNFSSVGALMSWTGIASALFSSLSVFWGAENIHIFHYGLIASMLWVMYLYFDTERKKKGLRGIWSWIFIVLLIVLPPYVYISSYLISNTYFMVYTVIISVLIAEYEEFYEKGEAAYIVSLFAAWLCMSRIEAFPYICFLLICYSYRNIPRKHFCIFMLPMLIMETGFVLYVKIQRFLDGGNNVHDQYTPLVLAIYAICAVGMAGYLLLYDMGWAARLRKSFPILMPLALLAAVVTFGMINHERLVTDVSVAAKNLMGREWGYTPLIFFAAYIGAAAVDRKIGYWDMLILGYVLFNFCLCLGRINDLRLGVGDSYNRMLLSIVPVAVIVICVHVFNCLKPENPVNDRGETL